MSAFLIYDRAPLGALIRYSDGTPQPPARFTRKLAAWKRNNGLGRLIQKTPQRLLGNNHVLPASFTLHEGDFSSRGVVLITVQRTYSVDSELRFEVAERPAIGMIRVLQTFRDNVELLHLAEDREAAELWVAKTGHSETRFEEVTTDELCADVVEGRAAA